MKDLFMCLLLNIGNHGNITEANMWGDISNITLETGSEKFVVSIRKEKKVEAKENA